MRTTLSVTINQNPQVVNLSDPLDKVKVIELEWFALVGHDYDNDPVPRLLYLELDMSHLPEPNLELNGENLSATTGYNNPSKRMVPLYFKPEPPTFNALGAPINWPKWHGKQPEKTRFALYNVNNIKSFRVRLLDESCNPYPFNSSSVLQLVFFVEYAGYTSFNFSQPNTQMTYDHYEA